jgi:ferritin-like metal-binding protein YciE
MNMKTLKDLFLGELADMHDAEHRLVKALPKMAEAATCTHLQKAILSHLKETEGHVTKIEQVFECFGEKAKSKTCKATKGLLEEGDEIAADFKGSPAINAALISAAQKVEHYEIASYGCLHAWAGLLENKEAAGLLQEILEEEKAANEALGKLALARSNPEALDESDKEKSEDAADSESSNHHKTAPPVTPTPKRATAVTH